MTLSHRCPFRSHISEVPWGLGPSLVQAVSSGRGVTAVVDTVRSSTTQSILQLPPGGLTKSFSRRFGVALWVTFEALRTTLRPSGPGLCSSPPFLCCRDISLWLCSGNKPCPFSSVPSPPDLLLLSQDGSSPQSLPMSLSFPPHVSSCQGFSRWTLTSVKGSPNTSISVLISGTELEILQGACLSPVTCELPGVHHWLFGASCSGWCYWSNRWTDRATGILFSVFSLSSLLFEQMLR